jgi:hypothetical protein
MVMVRKQIYLTQRLEKDLKKEAERRGLSEAALIRERLEHRCADLRENDEKSRKRFLETLRKARLEAEKYVGRETAEKFNREDAYKERLERQMPR